MLPFPSDVPPRDDRPTPERVLQWLDRLRAGVAARDERQVLALLAAREARAAPRAVLEEALALARAPATSLRAPLALLQFAWVVQRLAEAGEPMPGAAPADRAPDLDAAAAQLELAWSWRAARRRPA